MNKIRVLAPPFLKVDKDLKLLYNTNKNGRYLRVFVDTKV